MVIRIMNISTGNLHSGGKKKQAWTLAQGNRLPEARVLLKQICKKGSKDAESWFMLGAINGRLGLYDEAEPCFRKVVKLRPNYAEAHDSLGAVLQSQGKVDKALPCHRRAVKLKPDYALAHYHLGNALKECEDYKGAAASYGKALQLNSGFPGAHNNLGNILLLEGNHKDAAASFEQALRINPNFIEAYVNLGHVLQHLGELDRAIASLQEALRRKPDDAHARYHLGTAYRDQGSYNEAEACFRRAIEIRPDYAEAFGNLGNALHHQGKFGEARKNFEQTLQLKPDSADAIAGVAAVLEKEGKHEQAYEKLYPLFEAGTVNANVAIAFGLISRHIDRHEEAIAFIQRVLETDGLAAIEQQRLHFAGGQLCDGIGEYDRAFTHYRRANESMSYDIKRETQTKIFDDLIETCTAGLMARLPRATNQSQQPVFIVGMPRSGTSLVEQILASHPAVFGAGELEDIFSAVYSLPATLGVETSYPRCVESLEQDAVDRLAQAYLEHLDALSGGAVRVTDKMPHNFLHLGLIELLFPGAKVIHCLREPLDTCLSCYFQDFGARHTYTGDLVHLGEYYVQYERLMRHWQEVLSIPILDIRYEELVADQERLSRSMVEFCGLEWDDRCLQFYKSDRVIKTASYDQVRQPIYGKSVARWKNYEAHLEPLITALHDSKQV